MLFVPETEYDRFQEILQQTRLAAAPWGLPADAETTLTVGESAGFLEAGGLVNLFVEHRAAALRDPS